MISEEKINMAVRDAVSQAMSDTLRESQNVKNPEQPKVEEEPHPVVFQFDELDSLRVSNYILRVQNERLLKEVEERRRKHVALELSLADKSLHEETAERYGIDLKTENLQIDFEAKVFRVEKK